jgi:hypothetical protein
MGQNTAQTRNTDRIIIVEKATHANIVFMPAAGDVLI